MTHLIEKEEVYSQFALHWTRFYIQFSSHDFISDPFSIDSTLWKSESLIQMRRELINFLKLNQVKILTKNTSELELEIDNDHKKSNLTPLITSNPGYVASHYVQDVYILFRYPLLDDFNYVGQVLPFFDQNIYMAYGIDDS